MTDVVVRRSRFPGYDVLAKRDTPSWDEDHASCDRRATRHAAAPRAF